MNRHVKVDCGKRCGTIKPLHGVNNGPMIHGSTVNLSHRYRELGIPFVRLHDPNWPHPREVDIPQVFPDFEKDPANSASYDFRRTDIHLQEILDVGAQIVYRLGVSIEHTKLKLFTRPPADFGKWAQICSGIIRHYNEGWANGFRHGIPYWEIWNEPDLGEQMWDGTMEQYRQLYKTAAIAIKTAHPAVKVGGYAAARVCDEPIREFLVFCRDNKLPLDFFSWHTYAETPEEVATLGRDVRALLDECGFADSESHVNEWNYRQFDWDKLWAHGNESYRREGHEKQKNEEGASFAAATLILMQDSGIDVACYYDGNAASTFCGLFDYYGVPQKTFYAFKAFRELLDYPKRVESKTGAAGSLYSLAAIDRDMKRAGVLISNFKGTAGEHRIELNGLPCESGTCEVYVVDKARDLERVSAVPFSGGKASVPVNLDSCAVALLKIGA